MSNDLEHPEGEKVEQQRKPVLVAVVVVEVVVVAVVAAVVARQLLLMEVAMTVIGHCGIPRTDVWHVLQGAKGVSINIQSKFQNRFVLVLTCTGSALELIDGMVNVWPGEECPTPLPKLGRLGKV